MSGRKRLVLLVGILTVVAAGVAGITLYSLYQTAFEEQRARLIETAQSQARLAEAVARYDKSTTTRLSDKDPDFDPFFATLSQLRDAHSHFEGFGETGEFTLARRDGDRIVYLLRCRHHDLDEPHPVQWNCPDAEPMRLALDGKSGTIVGLDYRGETVLAAYEPVAVLNLGIVAKINLAEIQAPFIRSGLLALSLGLVLITVGAVLFMLIGGPMVGQLEESERKYRNLVESNPYGFEVIDANGIISYSNAAYQKMLGYTENELRGKSTLDLLDTDEARDQLRAYLPMLVKDQPEPTPYLQKARTKDGRVIDREVVWAYRRDRDNKVIGFASVITDITEPKQAEEALRESEEFSRAVIENSPLGISVRSPQGKLLSANAAWQKIWSVSDSRLQDYLSAERAELKFDEKDAYLEQWLPEIERVYKQGGQFHTPELRLTNHRSNETRWVSQTFYAINNNAGCVDRVVILTHDITEHKLAEEALRESEEKYRQLFSAETDAILVFDAETYEMIDVNEAAERMYGYSKEEFLHLKISDITAELDQTVRSIERTRDGDTSKIALRYHRKKDGTVFPVEVSPGRFMLQGRIVLCGVIRDITERLAAEQAVLASERKLSFHLQNTPVAVIEWNLDFEVVEWNASAEKMFGYTKEEALGRHAAGLLVPESAREHVDRVWQALLENTGGYRTTNENFTQDGRIITCEWNNTPLIDGDGRVYGVASLVQDITERKRVEEELARTEKLESLGLLAGGIAHDFNNILTGVTGNVSLAKEGIDPGSVAYDSLDSAEIALDRAKELSHQLLTFSRGGAPIRETTSVAGIIREAARFSLHGSNVKCELSLPRDLRHAEVDAGQISQVLNNLIINADQAMPDGGVIAISAENITIEPGTSVPLENGDYVSISIVDEGIGIPEEHLGRIFDPFYTTKQKGSGLGLASAFSMMRNHGGHIHCESQLGRGTMFRLFLPAAEGICEEHKTSDEISYQGSGRILVMDDEEVVRSVTDRVLTRFGYRVELVPDGAQAVKLYAEALQEGDPFDAVILDLTVPGGMGGREAVRELLDIDPDVQALVCSGYSNDPTLADYRDLGFRGIINKPFKPAELARVIYEVISQRRPEDALT